MYSKLTMQYPTSWHGQMWREGAPCGNGKIGALVYGSIHRERILLNHAHLWRGGCTGDLPDVSEKLSELRRLLDKERPDLADGVLQNALREGGYNPQETFLLPLGDLILEQTGLQPFYDYRRTVDMEKGEVSICWREGERHFCRSLFVSREDGLLYTRIACDRPGSIGIRVTLDIHDTETLPPDLLREPQTFAQEEYIFYGAQNETSYPPAQGDYGAVCRVIASGGRMETGRQEIAVSEADEVLLVTKVFVGKLRSEVFACAKGELNGSFSYAASLSRHARLHQKYYGQVNFELPHTADNSNEQLLLDAFGKGASDELVEKLYAYGRYLMVCATGEADDALPVYLTGLWNGDYACCWGIYMYNINFQLIYWQALGGGLSPLLRTALDYTERFVPDFQENAKKLYGCRGIFIDAVNTPETGRAVCTANHIINWTAGAAWMAQHFFDYWRYTGDETYLREHALPFLYQAALFYEDFLRTGRDGWYEFAPSTSPENVPQSTRERFGREVQIAKNAVMDIAVVRELLTNLLEGARHTGLYPEKLPVWEKMLSLLPPYLKNEDGSVKEWADDFYTDFDNHRHQSHLYPVYPGCSVTEGSPDWEGFVKAEDKRMALGFGEQSSWSLIHMACVNARMSRGDRALTALSDMARTCCMGNLFTVHNDWRRMGLAACNDCRLVPFQIDANIGFPAAVQEMLLRCVQGEILLLPALPSRWSSGKMEGLCAPVEVTLSIYWNEFQARAIFRSPRSQTLTLLSGSGYTFEDGTVRKTIELGGELTLPMKKLSRAENENN